MSAKPQCNCGPCKRRRAAQARWLAKNLQKRLAQNAAWRKKRRAVVRTKDAVTDAELDRRALETMPWRQ